MTSRFPPWMIVVIVVQLVLAALFFLLAYSETRATGLGAAPRTADIVTMAMPLAAVAICGGAAVAVRRSGLSSLAPLLVFAPLPLCFLLFAAAGLFW